MAMLRESSKGVSTATDESSALLMAKKTVDLQADPEAAVAAKADATPSFQSTADGLSESNNSDQTADSLKRKLDFVDTESNSVKKREIALPEASARPLTERQQLARAIKHSERDSMLLNINKRNASGETPLHQVVIKGDIDFAKILIDRGAKVNTKDYAQWTPLHEACNHGYLEMAELLLTRGANVNVLGCDKETVLHDASINGHADVVMLLLKHGANVSALNRANKTPLDVAKDETVRKILQKSGATSSSASPEMTRHETSSYTTVTQKAEKATKAQRGTKACKSTKSSRQNVAASKGPVDATVAAETKTGRSRVASTSPYSSIEPTLPDAVARAALPGPSPVAALKLEETTSWCEKEAPAKITIEKFEQPPSFVSVVASKMKRLAVFKPPHTLGEKFAELFLTQEKDRLSLEMQMAQELDREIAGFTRDIHRLSRSSVEAAEKCRSAHQSAVNEAYRRHSSEALSLQSVQEMEWWEGMVIPIVRPPTYVFPRLAANQ